MNEEAQHDEVDNGLRSTTCKPKVCQPQEYNTAINASSQAVAKCNKFGFAAGDHIVRTVFYPFIQVHGIVLCATDEKITYLDFGLSRNEDEGSEKFDMGPEEKKEEGMAEFVLKENVDNNIHNNKRMRIITLCDENKIKEWRKYIYSNPLAKAFKMPLCEYVETYLDENDEKVMKEEEEKRRKAIDCNSAKRKKIQNDDCVTTCDTSNAIPLSNEKKGNVVSLPTQDCSSMPENENLGVDEFRNEILDKASGSKEHSSSSVTETTITSLESVTEHNTTTSVSEDEPATTVANTNQQQSLKVDTKQSSPVSVQEGPLTDPATMVLYRVRFLLTNPEVIPKYQYFESNSECIAVWCKTGRWSTFQTSLLLNAMAINHAKQSFIASGLAVAVAPWVIPAFAGFALVYVGTPQLLLYRARLKWEQYTQTLTDAFWDWAGPDVYVYAINTWSGLQR